MSLQAWLARAAAAGKKIPAALEDLIHGTEELKLGQNMGNDMHRVGGMLGEGGLKDKAMGGMGGAGEKLSQGSDVLEQWLASHPKLAAGGAGLLGGAVGARAMADRDPEEQDDEEQRHHRGM